jgi:Uncharacterized protein conserved in bacteria (DUF2334)
LRKTTILFLTVCVALALATGSSFAATIIYYETPSAQGEQIIYANMMLNLVAHFDDDVTTAEIGSYQAGDLAGYDHAVFIAYNFDLILPPAFLDDVATNQHHVLWVGESLWQLTERFLGPGPFGLKGGQYNDGEQRNRIDYKGRFLVRGEEFSFWETRITGNPDVYSYFFQDGQPDQDHAHFLCGGNLCYLAEFPFWFEWVDDRMYVFADLLHEFFETETAADPKALVRFYEMAPNMVDIANIRTAAGRLDEMDIPFAFAVIPIFKDVQGWIVEPNTEWHFADDPDLVFLINDLLDVGGVLVQLGITHQFDNGSTGDSEFVLNDLGIPLEYDSESWVRDRIETGLQEFLDYGWQPKFWETPWQLASHGDFLIFSEYYDYYMDNPQIFPVPSDADPIFATEFVGPTNQQMPYQTATSASRMGIVPANLGCIHPGTPGAGFEDLRNVAMRLSIVRDAVVSFCTYSNIDVDDLEDFIEELVDLGFEFTDPEELMGIADDDDDDDDVDDDWMDDDDDAASCHECETTGDCIADLGDDHACVDDCCVEVPVWVEDPIEDDDADDDAQTDDDDDDDSSSCCGC